MRSETSSGRTSVVLITGASSGIGLATALHFARLGHDVYAGLRNPAGATELTEAQKKEKLPIRPVVIDVDDGASVKRGVGEVLERAGRIDVLVNNAGIGGGGPVADVPVDWAKTLFETNYFGAIRVIQAVLPGMRERRSGAIVNVSSVAGRFVPAGHGHYAAVKHALEAASEALAQEVQAFGIRVVIIEPGVVERLEQDVMLRWAMEHGLHMAAEALFDAGNHILAGEFHESPDEYREIPPRLVARGVISSETARRHESLAGFRNVLVHDYASIDVRRVQAGFGRLDDFEAFVADVEDWLSRSGR